MVNTNTCDLSAAELSERVSNGDISPVEIPAAHLCRIEEKNDVLKAFILLR